MSRSNRRGRVPSRKQEKEQREREERVLDYVRAHGRGEPVPQGHRHTTDPRKSATRMRREAQTEIRNYTTEEN